jgi:hypothetical protein
MLNFFSARFAFFTRWRLRLACLAIRWILLAWLGLAGALPDSLYAEDEFHAGFFYDHSKLTLDAGHRMEVAGPLFYSEQKETESTWAFPPLFSRMTDPATDTQENDFLYPILTYDRYGEQYRWQFCQLLSFSGGPTQTEKDKDRFAIFPIYFQRRTGNPTNDYTAVFPIYGTLKKHFFRDEIHFVMFPIYSETRKRDVVTDNYVYPFYHQRHGDGLTGWQLWPFYGQEHKEITSKTNSFGDVSMVPGHDNSFVMWPFYLRDKSGIGSTNPTSRTFSLPLFSVERSPYRDSTMVIWPFFGHVTDRGKMYTEWDAPWPLIVFARGEGKYTSRVWPIYSHAHNATLTSDFYAWPIYKYNRLHSGPVDQERTRILFFLFSDMTEKNTEMGTTRRRVDFFPFYTYHHDPNGNTRLQVLAILEPFLVGSHKVKRDWSPLWSLWRSERNPKTGAASQSLLWNLYRREASPTNSSGSVLFGLYQYSTDKNGTKRRFLFLPPGHTVKPAAEYAPMPPSLAKPPDK